MKSEMGQSSCWGD